MHRNLPSLLLLFFIITSLSGCYSLGWRFDECLYSGIADEVEDSGARQSFWGSTPTNVHGSTVTDKTTLPTTVAATYCRGLNLAINQKHYAVIPDHDDLSPTTAPGSSTMTAGIVFQANSPGNKALLYKAGEYGLDIGSRLITFSLYNRSGTILHSLSSSEKIDTGIPYLVFAHYEQNYSLFSNADRLTLYMYSWDGATWQLVESVSDTFAISNLSNTGSDLLIGKAGNTYFDGIIDEAFISDDLLSLNNIVTQSEAGVCTPCGTTLDHYEVRHSGSGVTCESVDVTFTGHDASHAVVPPGALTSLAITTSTGRGSWTAVVSGTGTLSDPVSGDGSATYQFPAGETSVTLRFFYSNPIADPDTVNFNVTDGTYSETSGVADPILDDPSLSMATAGFLFYNATDSSTTIPVQIAGKASNTGYNAKTIELRAVKASDDTLECEPLFAAGTTVTVDLGAECINPSTCQGEQVRVNGSTIATSNDNGTTGAASYSGVPLLFSGIDSVASLVLNYGDVGNINLNARSDLGNPPGSYIMGATNYTVRPFGLAIDVPGNPAASNANDPVFTVAGTDFTVNISAVAWQAADDGNDDGIPDGHDDADPSNNVDLSDNNVTPNFGQEAIAESVTLSAALFLPAGTNPGLSGTTVVSAFSSGTGQTTAARYDEVGIIEIGAAISDTDYLAIGATETARITGRSSYVGRFIPDNFTLSVANTGSFANTGTNPTFTYLGEPFSYDNAGADQPRFTITAVNLLGTTTQNYTGAFNKIDLNEISLTYPTSDASQPDQTGATPINITATPGTHLLTDNGDGTITLTLGGSSADSFTYTRSLGLVAPFNPDLTITLESVVETDDSVSDTTPPVAVNPSGLNAVQRFGRATLRNTFGPETQDQAMPLILEYYDGSDFLSNDLDTNSVFVAVYPPAPPPPTDLSCADAIPVGDIIDCSMVPVNDLTVRHNETFSLGNPGQGNTGVLLYTLDVPSWLEFDWDGNGVLDNDPSATATFGIYRGNDRIINWREIIQ